MGRQAFAAANGRDPPGSNRQRHRRVVARFGRLDILVNNAGGGWYNLAEDVSEEEFDRTIALNAKSTFFACQAAQRVMRRQMGGCIINMSSQAGFAALPTESVYCLNKAAIAHLTKCLAVEWGKYNIRVNAVAPTFISHARHRESALRPGLPRRYRGAHRRLASHRRAAGGGGSGGLPGVVRGVLITGHTLLIDGGWTAR